MRHGGYVLLPDSVHPSGTTYEWLIPPEDFPFVSDLHRAVLVQRLLRCTDGTENGLYSRIIPHFCGIKPELFLENLMPPCFSEFPSVDASTLFRRFATIENCSKSPQLS